MAIDPNRVKEVFLGATEQPDEAALAAYLNRACGGDAGLRERVETLLRSHEPDGSFLKTPAVRRPAGPVAADPTVQCHEGHGEQGDRNPRHAPNTPHSVGLQQASRRGSCP